MNFLKSLLAVLVVLAVRLGAADMGAIDPPLSEAEIAGLERENAMWRFVRVEDEAAVNLERLGRNGFLPDEVARIQERLLAIWDIDGRRNRGRLSDETMAQIHEIDKRFAPRMRAVRLYAVTGIQSGSRLPETIHELQRDWQRAIRRVLDHEEYSEFRLLNSPSAMRLTELLAGVEVNALELRTICLWQGEIERAYGFQKEPTGRTRDLGLKEAQLEHGRRLQALLGPGRYAIFLGREEPSFDRLAQGIGPAGESDPTTALTLWWMNQEHEIALMKASRRKDERDRLQVELTGKVMVLLGPGRYETYRQNADDIWTK